MTVTAMLEPLKSTWEDESYSDQVAGIQYFHVPAWYLGASRSLIVPTLVISDDVDAQRSPLVWSAGADRLPVVTSSCMCDHV